MRKKRRFQGLVLDNFTSHFHWYKKDFAWAENDLEEGWQQNSIRVAQKVQLHNPPHQFKYSTHFTTHTAGQWDPPSSDFAQDPLVP